MNDTLETSKIRVLHVLASLDRGGIETWLMRVLRQIDRDQVRMDFCCLSGLEGTYAPEARRLGSEIYTCRLTRNLPVFNRRFAEILSNGNYDIVHSHVHHFSGYILRQAAKSDVQQRIAHSFTAPPLSSDAFQRRVYKSVMRSWIRKYATLGLGNSEESMCSLFGEFWREDSRLQILYCGIDLTPFESLSACSGVREQLGIPNEVPIIGHLGRLTPAKNHGFFLEIAESIQRNKSDVWFLIVGDGPLREELEATIEQQGLANVVFTGSVSDITPYLGIMDMFLFPSLWEGMPTSVIEAQAADLYCLCSAVITDEVAVLPQAVQFEDLDSSVHKWAKACLMILEKPRIPRGTGVSLLAESPFSIERNAERLTTIYSLLRMDHSTAVKR